MTSTDQQKGGALCGVCTECGKCDRLLNGRSNEAIKKEEKMEQDNSIRLYTFIIYSIIYILYKSPAVIRKNLFTDNHEHKEVIKIPNRSTTPAVIAITSGVIIASKPDSCL